MNYRFNIIPIKFLESYFVNTDKMIQSLYGIKRYRVANTILRNESKFGGSVNFQTYYKSTVIKTVWYWQKKRHQ